MAKNLCLVCQLTPSSFQICKEVQKPCCGRGRNDYLFWMNAQKIFFLQLPKLNKYFWGVELDPVHQAIKKLKMDHLSVYTLYPTSCHNGGGGGGGAGGVRETGGEGAGSGISTMAGSGR